MLQALVRSPAIPSEKPPVLVLLHGLGSNEQDLIGLGAEMDSRLMTVAFRAPRERGPGGYSWYDVDWDENGFRADLAQAVESRDAIIAALKSLPSDLGVEPSQLFLGGFSQGAIMSLGVAINSPELLDGVLLFSGRLLPVFMNDTPTSGFSELPILVQHGTLDAVLPVEGGREIRDFLKMEESELTYREYPMAHEISRQSLSDAAEWLESLVK